MSVLNLIETCYSQFTRAEKKVANFILEDKDNAFVYMTLADIATQLEVGQATIVRFCHKLKLSGFQDLKVAIALENTQNETVNKVEDSNVYIENCIIDSLHKTRVSLNHATLEKCVDLVDKADNVYFYGIGTSAYAFSSVEMRFFRAGKKVKKITDPHVQLMQSVICSNKDVIIAVSVSGETKDLIYAIEKAKEQNTKIIVISNNDHSKLVKLADYALTSFSKDNRYITGSINGTISQMYLLELIFDGFVARNEKDVFEKMEYISKAITKLK